MSSSQEISVLPKEGKTPGKKTSSVKQAAKLLSKKTTKSPPKKITPPKTVIKKSSPPKEEMTNPSISISREISTPIQPVAEEPKSEEKVEPKVEENVEPKVEPMLKEEIKSNVEPKVKQEEPVSLIELDVPKPSPTEELPLIDLNPPKSSDIEKRVEPEPEPLKMSNQEIILSDEDLEKELAKYGYRLLVKIIINDEGEDIVKYIKVVNSQGQTFLIEMDVDGYDLNIGEDDIELISTTLQVIPYSIKVGSYESAQSHLYGVALECVEGLCVISRGVDLTPKENTFTYRKEPLDEYPEVELDESPIIYPVVKLTEVRENSKKIDDNINVVMTRIRAKESIQTTKELNDLDELVKKSLGNLEKFIRLKTEVMKKISQTLDKLQGYSKDYKNQLETTKMTDEDLKKYRQIGILLYERYDLYDKIIMASRDISLYQENFQSLNSSLAEMIKNLETQEKYRNPDKF